jgi:hypothetical protein
MRTPDILRAALVIAIGFVVPAAAQTPAAMYPASRFVAPPWVPFNTQYSPYNVYTRQGGE